FDGEQPMLSLPELLELVGAASLEHGREIAVVLEVKHASHFASIGLDLVPLIERDLRAAGRAAGELPLILESFESTVLTRLRERGIRGSYIHLIEASGRPFDLVVAQ